MFEYILSLANAIPHDVYLLLLAVLCIGALLLVSSRGVHNGGKGVLLLLLVEYVFLLYCSTIIFREPHGEEQYNFKLFWSYVAIINGDELLLPQNIMNVVAFLPIGFLLGAAIKSIRWWAALMVGLLISCSIEMLQFFFRRGFSEFDDVMHNTLGCMIGFVLWIAFRKCLRIEKKKQ